MGKETFCVFNSILERMNIIFISFMLCAICFNIVLQYIMLIYYETVLHVVVQWRFGPLTHCLKFFKIMMLELFPIFTHFPRSNLIYGITEH